MIVQLFSVDKIPTSESLVNETKEHYGAGLVRAIALCVGIHDFIPRLSIIILVARLNL